MKAFILPLTLAAMMLASPVCGQQPTPKPEMPPWNGAVFANTVTSVAMRAHSRLVHTYVLSRSLEE